MLQNDDKDFILKNLLRRIHNNTTTQKEKNVIKQIKKSYEPSNNIIKLSDKQLKKAIKRNRKKIMKKIGKSEHRYVNKRGYLRHIPHIIGSSAAAIILLLLLLTNPFTKNHPYINTLQTSPNNTAIEKQFTTGKEMKKIILADGSIVYLNQRTTVTLRKGHFNAHTREIWLDEGEAYFNVEKKEKRPFIIHTPNGIKTQVLGTTFNIMAYSELDEQIISVNTGSVQVSDENNKIILDPNFKVSIKNSNKEFITSKSNTNNISAWRSGTIFLESASIKEVALRLNQAFDINLVYNNVVNDNERIVTSFTLDTPQEEILATICKLYNVRYKRNNNRVELIK